MRLGDLPPTERADAGRALAKLGDPRPEATTLDAMQLCYVPAGAFTMGGSRYDDEKPVHQQEVSHPYWMSRYSVTNAQYRTFMEDGGYGDRQLWTAAGWKWRTGAGVEGPEDAGELYNLANHPVVGVSWYEAVAFCNWLTRHWRASAGLPDDWRVYLPSEAQWEKAARGGLQLPQPSGPVSLGEAVKHLVAEIPLEPNPAPQRQYPWGDEPDSNRANQGEIGIGSTSAVGCFPQGASPYGCEEMSGNVWEWCGTKWEDSYEGYRGDDDAPGGMTRVLRGGSLYRTIDSLRCAYRRWLNPVDRLLFIGFRVLLSPFHSDL